MSITQDILIKDKSKKMFLEGDWKNEYETIRPGYTSFNDAGLECEVGELLYGFVRTLQPDDVLETGTHIGIGASYIGEALKHNAKGHLDTIEFIPEIYSEAVKTINTLELQDYVTCHLGDAGSFMPKCQYDMILYDTEPQTRFSEMIRYDNYLKEGGYCFIHDLHRHMGQMPNEEHGFAWPWGKIPEKIIDWVKKDYYRPFHFSTPRGLAGFYKVSKDDYKWYGK